jgi:hypothetical protein
MAVRKTLKAATYSFTKAKMPKSPKLRGIKVKTRITGIRRGVGSRATKIKVPKIKY